MSFDTPDIGQSEWGTPLNLTLENLHGRLNDIHINVKEAGAIGDNSADDTAVIQSCIDTAFAGLGQRWVFFPAGIYRITAPLILHPGVTLFGIHGGHLESTSVYNQSCIKPTSAMGAATGIIKMNGQAQSSGLYSTLSSEQRIFNLTLDGSAAGGSTLNGIETTGAVHGVYIDNVQIRKMPARGIATNVVSNLGAYSWRMSRVVVMECGSFGYSLNNMTDSTFYDLQAMQCTGSGFFISGCGNSTFTNCRSEFNGNHGFECRGGLGIVRFNGCSTDRNDKNGFLVDVNADKEGIINISGASFNRDGKNAGAGGGGFAGLNVNGAVTAVVVDNITTNVGKEDNGTGADSPQYGVAFTNAKFVSIASGLVHGQQQGWRDAGGNTNLLRGLTVGERSGSGTAPTYKLAGDGSFFVPNSAVIPSSNPTGGGLLYVDAGALKWRGPSGTITTIGAA